MYLKYILKLVLVLKKKCKYVIFATHFVFGSIERAQVCSSAILTYVFVHIYIHIVAKDGTWINMRSMFQSITKKNSAFNCSENIFPYNVCHDSKKTCTFILNIFNLKIVLFFINIDSTLSKTEKWTNKCFSNMLINDF